MNASRSSLPSDATERERAQALRRYQILDTARERAYDDLTRLASEICQAPVSQITLIDGERQWYKSCWGVDMEESETIHGFCPHTATHPERVTTVSDLSSDARFADNPFVSQEPHVRAYAGAPLLTPEGVFLGAICVIDLKPREFTPEQQAALMVLSQQVVAQLELRKRVLDLEQQQHQLSNLNEQLQQFVNILSHDLKSPVRRQSTLAQLVLAEYGETLDPEVRAYMEHIRNYGDKAYQLVEDIEHYVQSTQLEALLPDEVDVNELLAEIWSLLDKPAAASLDTSGVELARVQTLRIPLRHILLNLLANAIKYSDDDSPLIKVAALTQQDRIIIRVEDNGPGIEEQDRKEIFKIFGRGRNVDGRPGRGLGLAIASKLAQGLGGSLDLDTSAAKGATFVVDLPFQG